MLFRVIPRLTVARSAKPIAHELINSSMLFQSMMRSRMFSTGKASNQIWIGGLPFSASKDELRKQFGSFGQIKNIEIQAKPDGRPSGVAVVTYANSDEAKDSLVMNKKLFGSRWMLVKLLSPENSQRRQGRELIQSKRVWISGLPYGATPEQINDKFGQFGVISDMEFLERDNGKRNGNCILTFSSPEEAEHALSMDEGTLGKRWLRVKLYHEPNEKNKAHHEKQSRAQEELAQKVFFGNIPYTMTEEDIAEVFSTCGSILDIQIYKLGQTNRSRGHGFVHFETSAHAEAAVNQLNRAIVGGREMTVQFSKNLRSRNFTATITHSVLINNLPNDIEESTLKAMFEHCGEVESIQLTESSEKISARLQFSSPSSAREAITLTGADIDGHSIQVELTHDATKP